MGNIIKRYKLLENENENEYIKCEICNTRSIEFCSHKLCVKCFSKCPICYKILSLKND